MSDHSYLLEFCNTQRQREYVEALDRHDSGNKAAAELGINGSVFHKEIRKIKARAAKAGISPDTDNTKPVAEGYMLKGTSTLYGADGQQKLQWVKTTADTQKQYELMCAAIEGLAEELPVRPAIEAPQHVAKDLANQYTITDFHIGMLAWHREGGDDWDISIAKETLKHAMLEMIDRSPKADTAIINQLGDFLHYDSLISVTPTSGHIVDADSRPEKMIEAAIECMDLMITESLKTHKHVKVIIAQGNHDLYSAIWLRKMFERLYGNNPRVEFISNAIPYYAFAFGETMLGYHHLHKVNLKQMPGVFANEFRELYGKTTRTYLHGGHCHHKEVIEIGKTVVEMHRTLAARDSHSSYGGYDSDRATDAITYHKTLGEVSRLTVRPFIS